jgi:hypothetical protein
MDSDQNLFLISTETDSLWVDVPNSKEEDLDELFGIGNIVSTIYDREEIAFYMLCNQMDDSIGLFLIKFLAKEPESYSFLIRWKNKRYLCDSKIFISRGIDRVDGRVLAYKELVVSYKADAINTYNIITLDLVDSSLDEKIK